MARRRKPPPSYDDKYRQIKESKFTVDIPKPTDARSKSMVTRYHRILFGGFTMREGKRVHTRGLSQSFDPYRGKDKQALNDLYKVKGAARIKEAYFPKQFGKVKRISNDKITFQSKQGKYEIYRLDKHDVINREFPSSMKRAEDLRIFFGASMQGLTFDYESLDDALSVIENTYGDEIGGVVHIGTFTFGN